MTGNEITVGHRYIQCYTGKRFNGTNNHIRVIEVTSIKGKEIKYHAFVTKGSGAQTTLHIQHNNSSTIHPECLMKILSKKDKLEMLGEYE